MLLKALYKNTTVWENDNSTISDWLDKGTRVVWTGTHRGRGTNDKPRVSRTRMPKASHWLLVYTPKGALGWVWSDDLKVVKR
jgi:hypothetical protein